MRAQACHHTDPVRSFGCWLQEHQEVDKGSQPPGVRRDGNLGSLRQGRMGTACDRDGMVAGGTLRKYFKKPLKNI